MFRGTIDAEKNCKETCPFMLLVFYLHDLGWGDLRCQNG